MQENQISHVLSFLLQTEEDMVSWFRDFRGPNNAKEESKSIENATPKKCAKNIEMLYCIVCGIQSFLEETNGTDVVKKIEKNEYSW